MTQTDRLIDVGGERSDAPALNVPEVTLFTVVFMVKSPGESAISLEQTSLLGLAHRPITHRAITGKVKVE